MALTKQLKNRNEMRVFVSFLNFCHMYNILGHVMPILFFQSCNEVTYLRHPCKASGVKNIVVMTKFKLEIGSKISSSSTLYFW